MKKDTKKAGNVVKESEVKPAKATKTGKVVKEPEVKPAKATNTGKVIKEPEVKPTKATKTGKAIKEPEVKPAKTAKTGKSVKEPDMKPAKASKTGKVIKEPEVKPVKATKKSGKTVKEPEVKPAKAAKTGKVVKEPEVKPTKATKTGKVVETPTNPTKTKVKKAAEKPKKTTHTNDLPAQARRIMGTPHMGEQPRNEIWYTTNDGRPVDIRNRTFGRNVVAKDHTFDGKNGVIRCNGVITEIGSTAFYACHNLTSISIPKSVDIINTYAFVGCTNLTDVTCKPATPPSLGLNIFTNSVISTVHVPANSVDAYKSANGWVFYKENVVPFVK